MVEEYFVNWEHGRRLSSTTVQGTIPLERRQRDGSRARVGLDMRSVLLTGQYQKKYAHNYDLYISPQLTMIALEIESTSCATYSV